MGKIIVAVPWGKIPLADELPIWTLLIAIGIIISIYIVLYVFRGIGLTTLAKRNNLKSTWLVWIPALWILPTTQIIGEYKLFGKKFKSFAWLFALIFGVTMALTITYYVLVYLPLVGYFLQGGDVYFGANVEQAVTSNNLIPYYWDSNFYVMSSILYPYKNTQVMAIVLTVIGNTLNFIDFAIIFIQFNVFFALFRRYIPHHSILFAVLSVFGIFAPLVFAVRNNESIEEKIKKQANQNRYGGAYGPFGAPFGNPYGNPNANQNTQSRPNGQSEPFGEYSDDPFEEFFNKKNNGDKR